MRFLAALCLCLAAGLAPAAPCASCPGGVCAAGQCGPAGCPMGQCAPRPAGPLQAVIHAVTRPR